MDEDKMQGNSEHRTNIIGAGEVNYAVSMDSDQSSIREMNNLFWNEKGNEVLGAVVLPKWGAFVSEEQCNLLGDVAGKRLLEIGCGKGLSLEYHGQRKAAELWG